MAWCTCLIGGGLGVLENAQAATLQPLDITHINLRADVDTPGGIPRKGAALVSGSTYAQQTYALADRSGIWSPKHNKSIEFLHIPKTGGTSIEDWSKSHNVRWGMNREWSELLPADGTDAKFSSGFNMSSRFLEPRWTPLRCQPWHIPRREFVARGGFDPYAGSRTFCVVKHPFARAVSDFIYQSSIKTAPRNATKATTFDAQAVEKACNPATLNAFYQVVLGMALPGIEKQANSWPHIDLGATSYYSAADSIIREAGLINQDSRATLLKESLSPRMFSAFFTPAANPFTSGNCHTVPQWTYMRPVENLDGTYSSDCDVVLHAEDLDSEFASMLRTEGVDEALVAQILPHDNPSAACNLTALNLTQQTVDIMRQYYKDDFQLLGYEPTLAAAM